jgi:protein-S-isoprenylcysteine O-methyltransferase Ste14
MWPPVAVGGPLVAGLLVSWLAGDPLVASSVTTALGGILLVAFALWNGWALATIARHRTALLPGGATTTLIDRGPFARSRNPLYLGLLAGSAGVALLAARIGGAGSSGAKRSARA